MAMKAINPDRTVPYHVKWSEMRPRWHEVPQSEIFGHHRGFYDKLEGTNFSVHIVILPFGQSSVPHDSTCEHVILQLDGEVEFSFEGSRYRLQKNDMLFIPAGIVYGYRNPGEADCRFASVMSGSNSWPPSAKYFPDLRLCGD